MLGYSLICIPFDFGPWLTGTCLSVPFLKSSLIWMACATLVRGDSLFPSVLSYDCCLWYLRTSTCISEWLSDCGDTEVDEKFQYGAFVMEVHAFLWSPSELQASYNVCMHFICMKKGEFSLKLTCHIFLLFAASVPAAVPKGCLSPLPRRLSIWEPTHPTMQLLLPVRVNVILKMIY